MSEHDSTWASGASNDRVAGQSPPQEQHQESMPMASSEPSGSAADRPAESSGSATDHPSEASGFAADRPAEAPTTPFAAVPPQGNPYPEAPTAPQPGYVGSSYQAPGAPYQPFGATYPGPGAPYGVPGDPNAPQSGVPYHGAPYWQPAAPAHHSGRLAKGVGIAAAAVALALFSGVAGGFVAHEADSGRTVTVTRNAAPVLERTSVAGVAARVQPSVVDITTQVGEGSGVIISADGAILTNNHVLEGARGNTVDVTLSNGKQYKATIVGTDPAGDLAVIKAQNASGLTPVKFGDSDAVQVGDTVLALGSPLGLQGSVTAGIVSALHRTIEEGSAQQQDPFGNGASGAQQSIGDAIQTDAAINPGNSGGALVNLAGEVIGINTAIATNGGGSGNIGVGFAISSNQAKTAADQLLKGQKVRHPYIGVQLTSGDGGALIADVVAGSPAEKAGLRKGDLVTKVGDRDVPDPKTLSSIVKASKVGDTLQLTVVRNGSPQQISVTVGGTN